MTRYIPVSTNAALGQPDHLIHPGFWQQYFLKELHEIDNVAPNTPNITSPNGFENIGSRYFTISWTEASPTDNNAPDGDFVIYLIEYSIDNGSTWFTVLNNMAVLLTNVPQGTTSVVWDLGAIPDTTQGLIKITATDSYGLPGVPDISDFNFTISGGSCF